MCMCTQRQHMDDRHDVVELTTLFFFCLGGEASLWDLTMNPSTQGPTLEQLQKVGTI